MSQKQSFFAVDRASNPFLQAPAPSSNEVEYMMQAARRAPDHGNLAPYRFIVVNEAQLEQLGKIFLEASLLESKQNNVELSQGQIEKIVNMPKRAPMVIISIACITEHPKAPKSEQLITSGLAVHQLCIAAKELGFDSMWRTGALAYNKSLHSLLNLAQNEEITGFIYVGTAYKAKNIHLPQNVESIFSTFGDDHE